MTVDEILKSLLAYVPENYDIATGSFFSDLLKPVATQLYILQAKIEILQNNSFALTASGEYLDRKAAEQGLTRKAGTYATGTLRIYGTKGEVVRAGAKAAAENVIFAVDKTVMIPECGYIDVTATCTTVGIIGNMRKSKINRFPVMLRNLTSVENITDFAGGYDEETDAELLERYLEKVSRPNVSGNKYHYIEWAKEVTGVGDVRIIPLWNGAGTVKVVITDADNQPASAELIAVVAAHIEENRPIGANVTVVSATALTVNISVKLTTNGAVVQDKIESAITEYLSGMATEKGYISYAKIGSLILSVDGVEDYSNLKINNGTSNINISDGAVPVLGNVVIA